MKQITHIITVVFVLSCIVDSVYSQIETDDIELSASASLMYRKYETAEKPWLAFITVLRVGYFFNSHIEVEPEIIISKLDKDRTGYILSANFAYNFTPVDSLNRFVPFLLTGIGITNSFAFVPNLAWIGYENEGKTILNAGGGLKIFLSQSAALRLEYRFQKYSNTENLFYHYLLLGFSVFL